MPRTRSLAWAELKVGLITVFALVMTGVLIFQLSGQGGFSWQQYTLKTKFESTPGLKEGAPVRVSGIESGTVESLAFTAEGNAVEVTMRLRKDVQPRVRTASIASLGSVSLLGESAVDITASSSGTQVPEFGYVMSGQAAGSLTEVATKAATGLEELTGLIADMRAGRGTVGRLMTDDVLYEDMRTLVGAMEQVASNINQGRGSLGRLATNPAMARSLEGSLANLEAVTARIRSGEGSLGRLLNDDAMARSPKIRKVGRRLLPSCWGMAASRVATAPARRHSSCPIMAPWTALRTGSSMRSRWAIPRASSAR